MEKGQVIWERNGSKFPFLASLQHDESRETVWNIAVLYTLYCLYGTQIPITSTNVAVAGDNAVLQIQPIRIDPMLFLELNMAVDRIAMVDLPVATNPGHAVSSNISSSSTSRPSSSSSSSSSSTGTVGRGVLHLFHRLLYTMDAFTYSLHAGPPNLNTVALGQAKILAQASQCNDNGRNSGSVRLRRIAELNEKLRGHCNIDGHSSNVINSSSSSSISSSTSSSSVSPMFAALNADIAAVYHGGPIRRDDMTGASAVDTAGLIGTAGAGATATAGAGPIDTGGDTDDIVSSNGVNIAAGTAANDGAAVGVCVDAGAGAAVTTQRVPIPSALSSSSIHTKPLAERKHQVMQERMVVF